MTGIEKEDIHHNDKVFYVPDNDDTGTTYLWTANLVVYF